jgi:hypothetical protein
MKKRILVGVIFAATCTLLIGCHMKHEWAEATCTEPKTCTVGGETEGEALGHDWQEATCSAPKTCSVCGETEGESLPHTWVDADYENPKTCSVCGETEGESLTPSFVAHGITNFIEEGKTYDYLTTCYDDTSMKTVGQLTVSDYRTFESDDTHEARDGYEWHTFHVTIVFGDENANAYGWQVGSCQENYYDIEGWDASSHYDETVGYQSYTVSYQGEEKECYISGENVGNSGWIDGIITYEVDYYIQTPTGYDGVVIGFRDKGVEWTDGKYIYDVMDENTLFFRIQ